ncbi:NAD(P)/FAD-dependent oxidoreductase [Elusimicrobiota bacterium]
MKQVEAIVVGAGLAGAACAKRLVDVGIDTVVLESQKLPRHKICSGILSPRGHRFLIENFGPLPREILYEPTYCKGVVFHFPSKLKLSMDFHGGPTPHLYRKHADHWAIKQSKAQVHEETAFKSLEARPKDIIVRAQYRGKEIIYKTRYLVGADGPQSRVTSSLYPRYPKSIPWFFVGQKFHKIIECPLSPEYFHFWFHPHLSNYTWSHVRENRQIVGVGFPQGASFNEVHGRVEKYLRENHGLDLEPADSHEGCAEVFGPSLINRYIFGKGNALITGQAAGFLNMIGEGMSCALHSGAIAGEAIVEARQGNKDLQQVYRQMIASEVRRCSDQWNPFQIIFNQPHEADFRKELKKLPAADQLKVIWEVFRFIRIYSPYNWGRQILGQALYRAITGHYQASRWS